MIKTFKTLLPSTGDTATDINYNWSTGLLPRGKRKDYFTACLPWPQKGDPITIPLGDKAQLVGNPAFTATGRGNSLFNLETAGVAQGTLFMVILALIVYWRLQISPYRG